ncbi:alpha/beta hydrolase [Pseudomonas sp. LRF_L74]|uniref:alpha/beta hydrolase n=1 Tax=Pseudomonas sp. LRF_L74 TaxID=3369422 RepID=UPI003F5F982E
MTIISSPTLEPFQPDRLRQCLCPLDAVAVPCADSQAYQRHYGLDLDAQRQGVRTRLGGFDLDGLRIAVQLWTPERPRATLVMLHGYYDHMGLYRHLVDWALAMNFAVIGCDLPGHGLSDGPRASIDDFSRYQATLDGLFAQAAALDLPRPWHLAGQSTGAGILVDHLLNGEPREEMGRIVLLSPLVRPRAWGRSRVTYHLLRPFKSSIARRFTENSTDLEFLDFVQNRDPLQPRQLPTAWVGALARWIPRIEKAPRSALRPLIVQGEADMTVEWRHNLRVLQSKFDRPEILQMPTARHHLVNEDVALRRQYFEFLGERLER